MNTKPLNGFIERKTYNNGTEIAVYETQAPDWRARMATLLIERWGMVAATGDGEDSSGRAKLRLLTPEEIVCRASSTAELAIKDFSARGWLLEIPAPNAGQR